MPLLWLSLAFTAGVFCGRYFQLPAGLWFGAAGLILVVYELAAKLHVTDRLPFLGDFHQRFRKISPLPFFILLTSFCLGAGRFQITEPASTPDFIAFYNDSPHPLAVTGIIVEPPQIRDTFVFLKIATSGVHPLAAGDSRMAPVYGNLLVRVGDSTDTWQYGDVIEVHGLIQSPPPEQPTYGDILAARGIFSLMGEAQARLLGHSVPNPFLAGVYSFKSALVQSIYRLFPDPEASLLAGILLGEDANIPKAVQEAFQETGTTHIIAISGFNMSIVAGLCAIIFGKMPGRWKRLFVMLAGIAVYAILVGGSAPVLRAALMSGSGLLAKQLGRRQDGVNTLAFTAALLCASNPWLLWDVGFQLSATATLGMILYADPLGLAFYRLVKRLLPQHFAEKTTRLVGEYILFTLAAQVVSVPVILYHFHRFSLSALVVNPLVLPVQPAVMILGGIAAMLGFLFYPLGKLAAILTWPFLLYTIRIVEHFSTSMPGVLEIEGFPLAAGMGYYAILIALPFIRSRWQALRTILSPSLVLLLLGCLSVVVWQAVLTIPHHRLEITVLNSGGAGGLLILTPGGQRILIDGGAKGSLLNDGLGRRLPAFERSLDAIIITGTSDVKIGGLLRRGRWFSPRIVIVPGDWQGSQQIHKIRSAFNVAEDQIWPVVSGQRLIAGDGIEISFLNVRSQGMLLLLQRGDFRALISTSDEANTSGEIGGVRASLLYLTDNGTEMVRLDEWLRKVHPDIVILSSMVDVGEKETTTASLHDYPKILHVNRSGWVKVTSDGHSLWAVAENP